MAWYNPATWKPVDSIQNKLATVAKAANSFQGSQGTRVYTSNPSGVKRDAVPAPAVPRQLSPYDFNTQDIFGQQNQVGGGGSGAGGGGGSFTAPVDPAIALRARATDLIHNIQSAYDSLFGGVDTAVKDQAGRLNSAYDQQTSDLNKSYERGQGETGSAFSARGLGQSSFLGDQLGQNTDIYNSNNQNIIDSRNNSLADLGKYAATTKAGFQAGKDQYVNILGELGNYDANSLNSLMPQLQSGLSGAQTQAAGLGTNESFVNGLNGITPVQNHGVEQLASKLQQIISSGAPRFAKTQLAQGLIKQAQLTDPTAQNYWQTYFQQLLGS